MTKKRERGILRKGGYVSACVLIGVFGLVILLTGQVYAKQLKTLIVAQAGDIAIIDPHRSSGDAKMALMQICDWQWMRYRTIKAPDGGLMVRYGDKIPGIIESWETEEQPDGTAIHRFHIRPNQVHHSGNPIVAADFKHSMMRRGAFGRDYTNRSLGRQYNFKEGVDKMTLDESIKILDDLTFEVHCKRNMPLFYDIFMMRTYLDSKLVQEHATKDDPWAKAFAGKNDAGCGPYTIEKWEEGNEMILKRFDRYWGPKPAIDRIIFKTVANLSSRVMLLKNGDVDLATNISLRELQSLKKHPDITVLSSPSIRQVYIGMNSKMPPFDKKDLRLALSYAFPYEEVISAIFKGAAQPSYGSIATGLEGALKERRYKTNLELAKKHLEKAGLNKGLKLTLKWKTGYTVHKEIGILFAANLRKIGVDLKLQQLPIGQYQTGTRKKTIDFFVRDALSWIKTPSYVTLVGFAGGTPSNATGYHNPQVNKLIEDAFVENDRAKRIRLMKEAQEIILDDVPHIFICQPDFQLAMRKDVVGYVAQNTELHHLWLLDKK